jgi:hypothetical protein
MQDNFRRAHLQGSAGGFARRDEFDLPVVERAG